MKKLIEKYLYILRNIESFTNEFSCLTPYAFECQRLKVHGELFYDYIAPSLNMAEGCYIEDAYIRSKDIFANLDKVYNLYTSKPFDLNDDNCIKNLAEYLYDFILKTETLSFLECKTEFCPGVNV